MPRTSAGPERNDAVEAEEAFVAALDAVDLPAAVVRGEHHGADDGVEAGGVAAAGGDGNAHVSPSQLRIGFRISPGSAWRRSAFLENTSWPSTVTSKTPPDDWTSRMSASGNACFSSAAKLAARGW